MSILKPLAASLLAVVALGAQAAGKAEVSWVDPAKFSDAGNGTLDRERILQELADHIARLGRQLPDGQTLKLTVTDLRLAGEPNRGMVHDYRVLRGRADWPSMQLRYELVADGRTLKSGEQRLSDMNYAFSRRSDSLGYEKRMIDDWFRHDILNLR